MYPEAERVAERLVDELRQIAAEHGVAVVSLKGSEVRRRYSVNDFVIAKALRMAGYWLCADGRWRAIAGARQIAITEEAGKATAQRV